MDALKDPVRGETLDAGVFQGREHVFRSDACQEKFPGHPEAFVPAV